MKIDWGKPLICVLGMLFCFISNAESVSMVVEKEQVLPIRKLKFGDQLVGSSIRDIEQDSAGYIWLATEKALHRYDGNEMEVFQNDPYDPASLPHNDLMDIYIDDIDRVWISSTIGVSRFDPNTNTFQILRSGQLARATHFQQDASGRIWQLNDVNAYYFEKNDDRPNELNLYQQFEKKGLPRPTIVTYSLFNNDQIFIVTTESCVIYDLGRDQLIPVQSPLLDVCKGAIFLKFIDDSIFIRAADNWVYEYNRQDQQVKKHVLIPSHHATTDIVIGKDGEVWVANLNSLHKVLPQYDVSYSYYSDPQNDSTLSDLLIQRLFVDREGLMWIASQGSGSVSIYNAFSEKFNQDDALFKDDVVFAGSSINTLFRDRNQNILVAYDDKLSIVSTVDHEVKTYEYQTTSGDIIDVGIVNDIAELNGFYWFATDKGVYKMSYDGEQPTFETLQLLLDTDGVAFPTIEADARGFLWVGTVGLGLLRVNPLDFSHFQYSNETHNPESLSYDIVLEIKIDPFGKIWVATVAGVSRLETPESQKFTNFYADITTPGSLCGRMVQDIAIDDDLNLWFATTNGIGKFDNEKNQFECLDEKFGFSSSTVNSVEFLREEKLIIASTSKGVSVLELVSGDVENYGVDDGIYGGTIYRSAVVDASGLYWVGTNKGLNRIRFPLEKPIIQNQKVLLTKLGVNYSPYQLNTPLDKLAELTLEYSQNDLQLDFALLSYTNPEDQDFLVKLENWDKQWVDIGNAHTVSYRNITPGIYDFKVALKNTEIPLSTHESLLRVTVLPPWWNTIPAYITYILLIGMLIYLIISVRTRQLKLRTLELESAVKQGIQETLEQKKTIEHLLSKKEELFANVSHEFRTPLTLILGPVSKILNKMQSEEDRGALKTVLDNARRLTRMVDQLLDLAKIGIVEQSKNTFDAVRSIEKILAHFDSAFVERNIIIKTEFCDKAYVNMVHDEFEKIITNLVSNAIKYSPDDSEIYITVKRESGQVRISVEDQGSGISEADKSRIFERFVRLDGEQERKVPGAGVGLALVKQLVEHNNGSVHVESVLGEGASFTVCLPASASAEILAELRTGIASELELETLQAEKYEKTEPYKQIVQENDSSTLSKVLIVEDHPEMQFYIQQSLSSGFECIVASNGNEGAELARSHVPDIIVTDLMMPEKDGFEFSQIIRSEEITSHIPIVMLTAKADIDTKKYAWHADIDEFFAKPFNAEELLLRCQNLLSIRQLLSRRLSEISSNGDGAELDFINEKDQIFLNKLSAFVEENYAESSLDANAISGHLAMSKSQLQRKIKAVLDQSVPEYVRIVRLNKSQVLLNKGKQVTEVAFDVGFANPTYFSSCFKAHFGITPKAYQKKTELA